MSEADALLATDPARSLLPRAQGPDPARRRQAGDAIAPLREATQRSGDMPLIAAMLGHALVATEDPKNFGEASRS
jgi:hypothetical protein